MKNIFTRKKSHDNLFYMIMFRMCAFISAVVRKQAKTEKQNVSKGKRQSYFAQIE